MDPYTGPCRARTVPRMCTCVGIPYDSDMVEKIIAGGNIIDIRVKRRWHKSKVKIPGASRENIFGDIKSWEDKYPKEKTLVLY